MEKIHDNYIRKVFYGCRFYRDDIESIIGILKDRNYFIKLTSDKYKYDTLKELVEHRGDALYKFAIEGNEKNSSFKSVSLDINKMVTSIRCYGFEDDMVKLIYGEIKNICESKKIKFNFPIAYALSYSGIILSLISLKTKMGRLNSLGLGLASLGFVYFSYFLFRKPLILRKRYEGGFWKRNQDRIWTAVITTIFTAVITFILTKIFL